jgi:hypothetical protein
MKKVFRVILGLFVVLSVSGVFSTALAGCGIWVWDGEYMVRVSVPCG